MTTEKLIWSAEAIAETIGRDEQWTYRALRAGKIPGAQKLAGSWAFNPRIFFASFEARP
jgi:hypothetical protein